MLAAMTASAGPPRARLRHGTVWALLLLLLLAAFTVRARPIAYFMDASGEPMLRADDAQYHARRALYSLENYPSVLTRDTYLDSPSGAHVPWPPLWDFLLASVAALLGGGREVLTRVLAWAPVVVGTLCLLAVAIVARTLASRGVALGAAAILAVLPVSLMYSSFGNADHHAAVALEAALLLAGFCLALRPGPPRLAAHALLGGARIALLLTWQGSLLYLALGEPLFLAIAALSGRRRALAAYGFGTLASAALVAPVVASTADPNAGPWLGSQLSWLHVLLLVAAGAVALASASWQAARPAEALAERGTRLVALAAGALGGVVLITGGLEPLAVGVAYLGREEPWIERNFESVPLFTAGGAAVARSLFSGFAYLLPLCPLAALWRAREPQVRGPALFLAGWSAALLALTLTSARFANDFAPAAAVCLALIPAEAVGAAARRGIVPSRLAAPLALALGAAFVAPVVSRIVTGAPRTIQTFREGAPRTRIGEAAFHRDLQLFAAAVRDATPATAGFLDAGLRPEYGILCFPAMGYALLNVAERPVTASGFGPYLGGTSFADTIRFYAQESEQAATALAGRLGARYVATSLEGRPRPTTLMHRLQLEDGLAQGARPALARFRLVTEAPIRGVPLGFASGTARRSQAPYKLFEIVAGALLEHRGRPGGELRAEVEIRTPGRQFVYAARAVADGEGVARLRVPYATQTTLPVRPSTAYSVEVDGATHRVEVSDAQVRSGETIQLGLPSP